MTGPKVAHEVALAELEQWATQMEAPLDSDAKERLAMVIMSGRLSFDDQSEVFSLRLRKPVKLENGEGIERIEVRGPTRSEQTKATKGGGPAEEIGARLLSSVTGQPIGVLDRIEPKDYNLAAYLLGFFV